MFKKLRSEDFQGNSLELLQEFHRTYVCGQDLKLLFVVRSFAGINIQHSNVIHLTGLLTRRLDF